MSPPTAAPALFHPSHPTMTDDDPYQVYMLRHPEDRASSLVPQLQKPPQMADTRLRYRRIAPNAYSGSFGSLGGHFPPLFKFPPRPSLLESLTSDDEQPSFAVRRRQRHASKRRRHGRRTPASALVVPPDIQLSFSAASTSAAASRPPLPRNAANNVPANRRPRPLPPKPPHHDR